MTLLPGFDLLMVPDAFANRTAAEIRQLRVNADKLDL